MYRDAMNVGAKRVKIKTGCGALRSIAEKLGNCVCMWR